MHKRGGEVQALRRMVDEVKTRREPDVDWKKVEAYLFAASTASGATAAAKTPARRLAWALAAACGLMAGGLALNIEPAPRALSAPDEPERKAPTETQVIAASELSRGERLLSAARPLRVSDGARAEWTLSPDSSVRMAEVGQSWVLKLESGAVSVQVTPGQEPGFFRVQAGDTEVTVTGTNFDVARRRDRVLVSVERGTVRVGAIADKTVSSVLAAGDSALFTLDGRSIDTLVKDERVHAVLKPSAAVAKRGSKKPPLEPTIAELEAGLEQVIAAVTQCFRQHTDSMNDVAVSVHVSLALEIDPQGEITEPVFSPPLRPEVYSCGRREFARIRFVESQKGARVVRNLELYP